MKLTAYRIGILVLTNALTGLLAFAVGGAYGQRMERDKKTSTPEKRTKIIFDEPNKTSSSFGVDPQEETTP